MAKVKDAIAGVECGTPYLSVKAKHNRTRMKALEALGGSKRGNSVRVPQRRLVKRMKTRSDKNRKMLETKILNAD